MTKTYTYRPHLRSKTGEATALQNLNGRAKPRIEPVFHLVEKVPNTFAADVAKSWAGLPLALDGNFNAHQSGSLADFDRVFHDLGTAGVAAAPAVRFGAAGAYLANVKAKIGNYALGSTLSVSLGDLSTALTWAAANGFVPGQTDLVVNLGDVSGFAPSTLHPTILMTVNTHLASGVWRSVTLAASSAPKDNSGLSYGRNAIPRRCWEAWNASAIAVPFRLDFGDYGTTTPELQDPPGYVMSNVTVSARYTTDKELIVRKGKVTKGKTGLPMPQQYIDHAKALIGEPAFGGVTGCWGDSRIGAINSGTSTPGNRTTWASIAASRHMSLVADRLP